MIFNEIIRSSKEKRVFRHGTGISTCCIIVAEADDLYEFTKSELNFPPDYTISPARMIEELVESGKRESEAEDMAMIRIISKLTDLTDRNRMKSLYWIVRRNDQEVFDEILKLITSINSSYKITVLQYNDVLSYISDRHKKVKVAEVKIKVDKQKLTKRESRRIWFESLSEERKLAMKTRASERYATWKANIASDPDLQRLEELRKAKKNAKRKEHMDRIKSDPVLLEKHREKKRIYRLKRKGMES